MCTQGGEEFRDKAYRARLSRAKEPQGGLLFVEIVYRAGRSRCIIKSADPTVFALTRDQEQ